MNERLLPLRRLGALAARATVVAGAVGVSGFVVSRWGWDAAAVRTQLLLTLLLAHLGLAYVVRASRWTWETGWWRNRIVLAAVGASLALQVGAFGTGWGRAVLALAPLPAGGWLLAFGCAAVALLLLDTMRVLESRAARWAGFAGARVE